MTGASTAAEPQSRPRAHFTPARNWMNDPNGLAYVDGVYHLFFQYNPFGSDWGNMSWGHATSRDLYEWTEHPVALAQTDGEDVFSGSVVVDHENTSGFGVDGRPPLVAIYTSAYWTGIQAVSLAYSNDAGMTWERFDGNPVIDRDSRNFRDPKVFLFTDQDGGSRWILVAVEAEDRQVLIYSSSDLREWTLESSVGPFGPDHLIWECPDLFPLSVEGSPDGSTWVLLLSTNTREGSDDQRGSAMAYAPGDFDGKQFTPAAGAEWRPLDAGRDFYAGVTFSNVPGDRRILLAWMSNWRYAAQVPTEPYRGAMSLPRELSLRRREGELPVLVQTPVTPPSATRTTIRGRPADLGSALAELRADGAVLARLNYDESGEELSLERFVPAGTELPGEYGGVSTMRVPLVDGELEVDVYIDGYLVEIFADGGAAVMSHQVLGGSGPPEVHTG